MQYRALGHSGLLVSPICLGTMTFGKPVAEAEAIRLTHAALDLGINFIDTANAYEGYDRFFGSAGGVAETILGKALKDRRGKVVLATKVGSPIGPGPQDAGLTPSHLHRALEASLRRLQTDCIDVYFIHWPDRFTAIETTLEAIATAVRSGKVRTFGISNHWAAEICEFLWCADKHGWPKPAVSQIPYSLLRREYHTDLDFYERHGIAATPYQALQGGLLTGKYRRGAQAPTGSRVAEKPAWIRKLDDGLFDKLEALEELARQARVSFTEFSLAWTLAQKSMGAIVLGATSLDQVKQAVAASEKAIPRELLARADEICPPPWDNRPPFERLG